MPFYRNSNNFTVDIAKPIGSTPALFKYVTSTNVSSKFYDNNIDVFTTILNTGYSSDFVGISEHQNTVGYSVGGTDISTYSIAPYIDSVSYPSGISNTNIPAWCTAIRVIMIGGGGDPTNTAKVPNDNSQNHDHNEYSIFNAKDSTRSTNTKQHDHTNKTYSKRDLVMFSKLGPPSGENNVPTVLNTTIRNEASKIQQLLNTINNFSKQGVFNVQFRQQHNNHEHGTGVQQLVGGAGGGFVYISSLSTQTYSQFNLLFNQSVKLQLNQNASSITVLNGQGNTPGQTQTSGQIQTQGSLVSYPGQAGQGPNGGNSGIGSSGFSTTLPYGKGGSGGGTGQGYYYRVYFLSS